MAHAHVNEFAGIPGCRVVAACDIDADRVKTFAENHGISASYVDLNQFLADPAVDAVSVVTSDAAHAPVSLACLKAGRHVLCEKPLALNVRDARKMQRLAERAGVVNMVNFSYRGMPAIQEISRRVARGDLGELRHVEASYLQAWLPSQCWGDWKKLPHWLWRLSSGHGSMGALGDVGVHILDFATYPCGPLRQLNCRLRTFPKAPGNRIGPYKLDANDSAIITVEFRSGALGVIHTTRWFGGHANRLALNMAGTQGSIEFDSEKGANLIRVCTGSNLHKNQWITVKCPATPSIYRRFVKAIRVGRPGEPDFARGAEVQAMLDACFASDAKRQAVRLTA